MVAANVKIVEDLQAFLSLVGEEAAVRHHFTSSPKDFTRKRQLPLERVVQLIVSLLKRSLSVEIREFFATVVHTGAPCTKGAFSQQRQKLKASFFFFLNQLLVSSFYEHYGSVEGRWRGFRLLATDGSTAYLPGKPALREYFGVQVNQYKEAVMARLVQTEDVLNHLVVQAGIYPITTSEHQVVCEWVSGYAPDSLVLLDRGFACYLIMYLLQNQETPLPFVIRCKTGGIGVVERFLQSEASSQVVEWKPTGEARTRLRALGYIVPKDQALSVRLVRIPLSSGEVEVLCTNLLDEQRYTVDDLRELYGLRWSVETTFGRQKNPLQLEEFSGLTVRAIEQDYAAGVFVQNLQRLIEQQCTAAVALLSAERKHTYQINQTVSFAALKSTVAHLMVQKEVVWLLLALQRSFERHLEPRRPGRKYPRIRKNKRMKGRYQTYTNFKRPI